AAFELAAWNSAPGRFFATHLATWARATGYAAIVAGSVTPLRTAIVNAMSRVYSAKICSGDPVARLSSVGSTDPSIEFSMGTHARAASADLTISSAAD